MEGTQDSWEATYRLLGVVKTISTHDRGMEDITDAPRMMVALPRAVPIPLPFIALGPTRLNL